MKILENFGWNNFYINYLNNNKLEGIFHGRIISLKGFKYIIITEQGELEAELSGKMLYGKDTDELPKVGDWVFFISYGNMGYITDVFPRTTILCRKNPGTHAEKQVMATNIDCALIVQSIDRDFNLARLERYIVQVLSCNINPVVLLNKADLTDNPSYFIDEVKKLGRDCPVYLCSTLTKDGVAFLFTEVLQPAKTYVLIGSSGVGKSSILNSLTNFNIRETGSMSVSTGKGKHVTTTRDLFQLQNGSLVIDTPGMREFGLAFDEDAFTHDLFPAISVFAQNCKYENCKHTGETGCAVIAALNKGELEPVQYENYLKLMREQAHFSIKAEDKKRLGKQFGKMVREAKEYRKKYKF